MRRLLQQQTLEQQTLQQASGLDRGMLSDLQSGVVILAPLAASAVSAFLPH